MGTKAEGLGNKEAGCIAGQRQSVCGDRIEGIVAGEAQLLSAGSHTNWKMTT